MKTIVFFSLLVLSTTIYAEPAKQTSNQATKADSKCDPSKDKNCMRLAKKKEDKNTKDKK